MAKVHVSTSINGDEHEFLCEPQQTLLDVLREDLGMTGTKEGCATGDCGACSVLINGRLVCSCLTLAVETNGVEVTTIEGIAGADGLHPIQQKFLEHGAVQCGFCTPGLIMSAKALLDVNTSPTEQDINEAMAGAICRCTGHIKVKVAIREAAKVLRERETGAGPRNEAGAA